MERGEEEEGQPAFQGCVLTENRRQGPDCQAAATLCQAILALKFSLQEMHVWLDPGTSMLYLYM